MKKQIISMVMASGLLLGATACGGTLVDEIDKNKTQIYVSVYNGGVGYDWIEKQKDAWNATNDKYQVIIKPEQTSSTTVRSDLNMGVTGTDAYWLGDSGMRMAIEKGQLEDLSDIMTMKVDGTDKTVGDKLTADSNYFNVWKDYASKSGEGLYMLPYADSFIGLLFDYDTFVENNWLIKANATDETVTSALTAQGIVYEKSGANLIFKSYTGNERVNYEDGDLIMSVGKDGKYGTYDDGQPQTLSEFTSMVNKIVNVGTNKAFIWTGQYSGYTEDITTAIMAQYSGIDAYNAYYSFDSKGKQLEMYDGSKKAITPDNGYEVYGLAGYKKAVEFMNTFFNNSKYIHPKSTASISHIEAQNLYLLGYRGEQSNPFSAMLVDGGWWENESHAMFDSIAERDADRGYGKRDYRYMLLPKFDGQAGIDGEGNGSVVSVRSSGCVVVPKCSDAEKLSAIKEFIAYTLSNENLRAFTRQTGVMTPYDFEVTAEDRETMTPFSNTMWDIYTDKENVTFIRPMLDFHCSPIKMLGTGIHDNICPVTATVPYACVVEALEAGKTVDEIVEGTARVYSASKWSSMLAEARAAGFYKTN